LSILSPGIYRLRKAGLSFIKSKPLPNTASVFLINIRRHHKYLGITPVKDHIRLARLVPGEIPDRDELADYAVGAQRMDEEVEKVCLELL
jgi:hypothetical protein